MRYSLPLLLLLSACATTRMEPGASQVRIVSPGVVAAQKCSHLGMVRSFQPVLVGGMSAAQVDVRNKIARAGGNAYVVAAQSISPEGHGEVVADAYACAG